MFPTLIKHIPFDDDVARRGRPWWPLGVILTRHIERWVCFFKIISFHFPLIFIGDVVSSKEVRSSSKLVSLVSVTGHNTHRPIWYAHPTKNMLFFLLLFYGTSTSISIKTCQRFWKKIKISFNISWGTADPPIFPVTTSLPFISPHSTVQPMYLLQYIVLTLHGS